MDSRHYMIERKEREQNIQKIGIGKVVDSFKVDRKHRNGPEIHKITNTGIILVYNEYSGKLITKLIARPGQIRRYYENSDKSPKEEILRIAREHQKMGLNK